MRSTEQFSDSRGRVWSIVIDADIVRDCQVELGIALLNQHDINGLAGDTVRLVGLLHHLWRKSNDTGDISPAEFAERLGGMLIDSAGKAMLDALSTYQDRLKKRRNKQRRNHTRRKAAR